MHGWVPILIMIGLGAGFGAFNIVLSHLCGPKKPTAEKLAPYECGMPPVGDARERQSVKFYLVAMIFLLFDIEVAFPYPWAMALRDLGYRLGVLRSQQAKLPVISVGNLSVGGTGKTPLTLWLARISARPQRGDWAGAV